jgi:hypothetical protein
MCEEYQFYRFWNFSDSLVFFLFLRGVWRYQRGNQNPYIEEEQTTQWTKEKVQEDKQRSTKHTHKSKDRVTRTPLTTGDELRCFGRIGSELRCCGRIGSSSATICLLWPVRFWHQDTNERRLYIHLYHQGLWDQPLKAENYLLWFFEIYCHWNVPLLLPENSIE